MNINVDKDNLTEITETIESIFNKARQTSTEPKQSIQLTHTSNNDPQTKKKIRMQSVTSQASKKKSITRKKDSSLRGLKQSLRYSTNSRNGYGRLKMNNDSSIGKKSAKSSTMSMKKTTPGRKKTKPKRFQRSGSNISNQNTFGNYLSNKVGKPLRSSKLGQRKSRKPKLLKNGKPKYSNSSSSSIGNQTFSGVLKDFKRYKKVDHLKSANTSSQNVSGVSGTVFNNQFEGYFSKNTKSLAKKASYKVQNMKKRGSNMVKFTRYKSKNPNFGARKSSKVSSIGASSQSSFGGANDFSNKFNYEQEKKGNLKVEDFTNIVFDTENSEQNNSPVEGHDGSVNSGEFKESENESRINFLTEKNPNSKLQSLLKAKNLKKKIGSEGNRFGSYAKKRILTTNYGSKKLEIGNYKSRANTKIKPFSPLKEGNFSNLRRFLSPKNATKSTVQLFDSKNKSISRQSSTSKLIRQSITLDKFKRIGTLGTQQSRGDSKVSKLEQLRITSKEGTSPTNHEDQVLIDQEYKDSQEEDTSPLNAHSPIPAQKLNSCVNSPEIPTTEDDKVRLINTNNTLISDTRFAQSPQKTEDEPEKSVYYNLYVKQRDENIRLKQTVSQLVEELTESNKRSEVKKSQIFENS